MTKTRTPIRQGKQSAVQQRNRMLIFGGVAVAVILVAVVFLAQSNQPAVRSERCS